MMLFRPSVVLPLLVISQSASASTSSQENGVTVSFPKLLLCFNKWSKTIFK